METLIDLDKKLFLFLHGLNNPFLDPIMYYATNTFFWLPIYLLLIFLIFKNPNRFHDKNPANSIFAGFFKAC